MNLNIYTVDSNRSKSNGYGYAYHQILDTLRNQGHTVNSNRSDIQISFCQPNLYQFDKSSYKIGYTPWESTEFPADWIEPLKNVDEIWTTSAWCAGVFYKHSLGKPVYVYNHGIDPIWQPRKRERRGVLRFLHVGEPAPRKAGQMAMEAFVAAFGHRTDVSLTIKAHGHSTVRVYENGRPEIVRSIIGQPQEIYRNINVDSSILDLDALVALFYAHDVLVYPSYGEGFGFIPLQALASGMPTICTDGWPQYKGYTPIKSELKDSPWPKMHPGKMLHPSFEHLVEQYRMMADNFEIMSKAAFDFAPTYHEAFNWDAVTREAFEHLER